MDLPDVRKERPPGKVQGDLHRVSAVIPHDFQRHAGEIVFRILRDLPPVPVDRLFEKTALVEKPDADEGDVQIARRFQVVAREGAETAGVYGETIVKAVFGGEVGDRLRPFQAIDGSDQRRRIPVPHVAVELIQDLPVEVQVAGILRGLQEALAGDGFQHPDGIVADPRPQLGVQCGKEFARKRIPRPPEVVGQLAETFDLRREVGDRRKGPEMGGDGNRPGKGVLELGLQFLPGELLRALFGGRQRVAVCFPVALKEILPVGPAGDGAGVDAHALQFVLIPAEEILKDAAHVFRDRLRGLSPAPEQDDPVAVARHLLRPETETGLIRRECRNGVGRALQGGIPPGFVIGGENPQIAAGKGLIVGDVQQAVVSVQVGRNEDDLDPVLGKISKAQTLAGLQDGIERLVLQPVRGDGRIRRVGRDLVAFEGGDQVRVSAQDEQIGKDGLIRLHFPVQAAEGFQEKIDPLVVEFAPP